MKKLLIPVTLLSIWCLPIQAQTPSLVNATSGLNSLTASGGAQEGVGCATNSYCAHLADPSLAGNTIIVFTTYDDNPGSTVSVSDDKSNAYTAGPAAHDSANGRWVAVFYARNATAGTYNVTITWSAGVAHMSAMVQQWMNIGALDASSGSAVANGGTTVSSGSLTPTATGDLVIQYACRTQNIAASGYAAGSQSNISWAKLDGSSDRIHGCVAQFGIYNSTATLNPTLTWSGGSGGATVAVAFAAAAQGTAAKGMHIVAIEHFTTANNLTGSFSIDLPASSTNNLIVFEEQGGGSTPMTVTGVTDSNGNTWNNTGPASVSGGGSPASSTWYAPHPNLSQGMTLTINTAGNGDIGGLFYIISGAAASPFGTRVTATPVQNSTGNLNLLNITPGNSSGLVIASLGVNFNTVGGIASPAGARFDSESYGGENISGPISVDENNGWGHFYNTNTNSENWTWTFWVSNLASGQDGGEADFFDAATSTSPPQPPTNLNITVQ